MGKLNEQLKKNLDVYIATTKIKIKTFNSEDEIIEFIKSTNLFYIENAIVDFKLDIRKIVSHFDETQASLVTNIKITNCSFPKGVSFYKCKIGGNLYFWENKCSRSDFSHCIIGGLSYFSNTTFYEDTIFDCSIFCGDSFFWGVEFKKEISFRDCDFKKRIDFWCSEFRYKADFNFSIFRNDVDFSNCIFFHDVSFQNTAWGEDNQEGAKIIFDNANFHSKLSFNGSSFKTELSISKARLILIEFERSSFWHPIIYSDSTFEKISFKHAHFHSPLYLTITDNSTKYNLDFSGIWSASLISIEHTPSGENRTDINVVFDQAILTKSSITIIKGFVIKNSIFNCNDSIILGVFSIANSDIKTVHIKNSSIIGSVILKSKIKYIDLSNSSPSGSIITNSNVCINSKSRETANILRHEKEKEGDLILALKYRKMEMNRYNQDINNLPIKDSVKNIEENIIVKLNHLSNNYGQSWIRGIVFTCIASILSTIILGFTTGDISLIGSIDDSIFIKSSFWEDVILFLWLPSTSLESIHMYGLLYLIIYILGKITITYGIIQTVLSFRKYSKA